LLEQLAQAATLCEEVQRQLGLGQGPALETILKLHRVLVLKFSLEAEGAPEKLKLVAALMKPILDYARLEEKAKAREQQAREAARANPGQEAPALTPATLERIERELNLF
jgi:hypothetical protein